MTIKKSWVILYCLRGQLFSLRGTWHISGSRAHTHTHTLFIFHRFTYDHVVTTPAHLPPSWPKPLSGSDLFILYTMLRNDPCNPCGYSLLIESVWHTNLNASSTPQYKNDSNAYKSGALAGLLFPRVFLIKNSCVHCSIKEKGLSNSCQMGFPLPPHSSA